MSPGKIIIGPSFEVTNWQKIKLDDCVIVLQRTKGAHVMYKNLSIVAMLC